MDNLFTHIKWKMRELDFLIKKRTISKKKINYARPKPSWMEEVQYLAEGFAIVCFFAYFFYRSYVAMIVLSPGIWFYRKERMKKSGKKRKCVLEQQFKETLISVQANLQSGYSVENAFVESYGYVVSIYGKNSDMAKELLGIQKGIRNGDSLEHLLLDLGRRCPESSLEEFSNVYSIACKSGGGWTEIIMKIVAGINQRMEIKQEIETLVHGKKMESRVMSIIPFFILFYMDVTSKGYFNVLYHNPVGILIMTICLGIYITAFLMSEKITEI